MTISGMTGFARVEGEHGGLRWAWEVRSVNGRGLDLKLRTPAGFDALEPQARALAQAKFKRGSVQASLSLTRDPAAAPPLKIDHALIEHLLRAGQIYVDTGRVAPPRWDGLLTVRGVMLSEESAVDEAARLALEAALLEGLGQALAGLDEARKAEGRVLAGVFTQLADRLDAGIAAARACAAAAPAAALERIKQKLAALSPEVSMDPLRVAQEATLAATRADVSEELERLVAHAAELRSLLKKPEPAGRRLDFLSQELTREANTLSSKSSDLELTRIALDLKIVVDQIKEQAANVE
ncbi:MAG: YicC/YloC family endoribonuclease [Hyphomonadaceae bacterium]|nr:YicC/YloC family endoribonuclease [Hyphomonadaceae bacterium]